MTSERVFDQWTMEHGTVVLPYHIITYCAHHPNMIGFLLRMLPLTPDCPQSWCIGVSYITWVASNINICSVLLIAIDR